MYLLSGQTVVPAGWYGLHILTSKGRPFKQSYPRPPPISSTAASITRMARCVDLHPLSFLPFSPPTPERADKTFEAHREPVSSTLNRRLDWRVRVENSPGQGRWDDGPPAHLCRLSTSHICTHHMHNHTVAPIRFASGPSGAGDPHASHAHSRCTCLSTMLDI